MGLAEAFGRQIGVVGAEDAEPTKHLKQRCGEEIASFSSDFRAADADGDQMLDFDEFVSMLPERSRARHTREQMRDWFDTMDVDQSG